MTLEDFFTLTEMKDGLTAPARVQELIIVMKNEKDGVARNVGDTTRQWAAVASTIAATENKECLDLFIQLDGLWFIDRWLKDAQTFADEASVCFVEEAISALLLAVEKLQIDDERLFSSGISITVKDLLSYKSPKIQDRATALINSWKFKNVDIKSMDAENAAASDDANKISEHPNSPFSDPSLAIIHVDQKSNGVDEGENVKSTNDQDSSHITSSHADVKDGCPDSVASLVKLDAVVNDLSAKDEVLCSPDENLDSKISAASKQGTSDVVSEKCDLIGEETMEGNKLGNLPDNVDKGQVSSSSGAVEEAVTRPDASTYNECERLLAITSSFDDTNQHVGKSICESRSGDVGKDDGRSLEQKGLDQGIGSMLVETKDQGTTECRLEEVSNDDEVKRQWKNKKKRIGKSSKFARLAKHSNNTDLIRQTANMDIEDGTFDALEVACLVANEVAREIVNYVERSGSSSSSSSSSENSFGGVRQPGSPESIAGEQVPEINEPINESQTMENVSVEASEKEPLNISAFAETENHLQEMESSQLNNAVIEPGSNTAKCVLEFDLNQEFSSEDLDEIQVNAISNSVSVVSASRAMVGPGMPAGPLKFEGTLGWKGSAPTSAFRPASPRRTSDTDRALSGGATSSGSRQRLDFLDIDLNIAGGDHQVVHHMSGKEKQMLPGLRSGESSVDLSSKQSERLKFDLNQTEDDGSASSSSCIQPATKNFDLNYNPSSNGNDPSYIHPFPWGSPSNSRVNPYIGREDDSVISILGTKVKKGAFPPQTLLPFQNGWASESLVDANLLRGRPQPLMGFEPPIPYPQSVYGFPNLGPSMSFSSAPVYGPANPFPYMFDTRGAPFAPQIAGPSSAVSSSYGQPSLGINMMGATPAAPNVDLNSGFAVDGGNRDPTFFRQLFIPGQGRQLDDHLRDGFRPLSSGAHSGKRKEPESGWELFSAHYKHHQPPHL